MNYFHPLFSKLDYIIFPFYKDNKVLENAPLCGMTVRKAGSMRFRWNETNPKRDELLGKIAEDKKVIPVELIHSKTIFDVVNGDECFSKQGDGIITKNPGFMPVITVADCVPLYLYDSEKGVFGVIHSGWKGTGIIGEAVKLAVKNYGCKTENISVVIGPHIHDCCYIVNEERAEYFASNFTPSCVKPLESGGKCLAGGRGLAVSWNNGNGKLYRLSLLEANIAVLRASGIKDENIAVCDECTCCNELLGSNRRESAEYTVKNPSFTPDELTKAFTVQAAFVKACADGCCK